MSLRRQRMDRSALSNNFHPPRLLICGASARAAAHSAVRAGLQPVCADLFGDEDLRAVARHLPVEKYPHDFRALAHRLPACAWMYTGALENHPAVIAAVSRTHALCGNTPPAVRLARDPVRIQRLLQRAELPALSVRSASDPPPPNGGWLRKPIRSAAGRRICVWDAAATADDPPEPCYFQQRAFGIPHAAVYLADGRRATLVGVSRQFVGEETLTPKPFEYCGSLGPVLLPQRLMRQIEHIGQEVARGCGLRGLFGVDFVCDEETAWLTEINPRYTASVEVFEHAYRVPLLRMHMDCFADDHGSGQAVMQVRPRFSTRRDGIDRVRAHSKPDRIVGKLILFAKRECTFPDTPPFTPLDNVDSLPPTADVPAPGTTFSAGDPICTLLADGADETACLRQLARRVADAAACFGERRIDTSFLIERGLTGKMLTMSSR